MALPPFRKTTVRPALWILANTTLSDPLAALVKLYHIIGGVYMCACLHRQDSKR